LALMAPSVVSESASSWMLLGPPPSTSAASALVSNAVRPSTSIIDMVSLLGI
jgi:hypothetical protein